MPAEYLSVFWDEILVGRIAKTRAGRMRFQYDQSWLGYAAAVPISLSLPLQKNEFGYEISICYFENILPEEDARTALARAAKLHTKDAFGFLQKFGRECKDVSTETLKYTKQQPHNHNNAATETTEHGVPMSDTLARIDDYQQRINAFRPFGPDLLPMLRNYYRIGLTYTSTAIEGFSYTESETKILLEEGLTVGGRPLQDALAVTGHAKAYDPACSRRRLWLGEQLDFSKAGSFKRKR